jgi:glycosyltransferase involved in cell wall biosynthesis
MKFSVLVNNHNNGPLLLECVNSALAQSRPPEEIIVVDDGSTDASREILLQNYGTNPTVKIVLQANLGHTAAIAAAIENATGDILCLLDSDDRYRPTYLAELEAHYTQRPYVDLTFCRFEPFGEKPFLTNEEVVLFSPTTDYDYGYSARLTYFGNVNWLGNITSTLSLRAFLARKLDLRAVIALLNNRLQGEYPLLLAASLAGGRKYYLHQALVDYRHHAKATTRNIRETHTGRYAWNFYNEVRFNYYKRRSDLTNDMRWKLSEEAETVPAPLPAHLALYRKAFWTSLIPPFLLTGVELLRRFVRKLREIPRHFFQRQKETWSAAANTSITKSALP